MSWPGRLNSSASSLFGQRHAHGVGNALAQRAGGGFDAGGDADFGVAGGLAVQLAEVFQVVDGQVVAGEVQQAVDQHGAVAVGEHEAVAVGPLRVGRVVAQVTAPQHFGHVGHAHGGARVAGVGFLNGVHGQRADSASQRIEDRQLDVTRRRHRKEPWAGETARKDRDYSLIFRYLGSLARGISRGCWMPGGLTVPRAGPAKCCIILRPCR